MMDEALSELPKRGPGRRPKFDLESALFSAVKAAFPKGAVTIVNLPEGHPKVAARGLPAQVQVRVAIPKFAVATMIPATGGPADVAAAVANLRRDWEEFNRSAKTYAQTAGG